MNKSWVAQGGYWEDMTWQSKEYTCHKCIPYPKQYLGSIHTIIIDGRLTKENAIKVARERFRKFLDKPVAMFAISKGDFKNCLKINDKIFEDKTSLIYIEES